MIKLTFCLIRQPGFTREAGRLLLEDEKRFIDLERSPLWWGEEKEIIGPN